MEPINSKEDPWGESSWKPQTEDTNLSKSSKTSLIVLGLLLSLIGLFLFLAFILGLLGRESNNLEITDDLLPSDVSPSSSFSPSTPSELTPSPTPVQNGLSSAEQQFLAALATNSVINSYSNSDEDNLELGYLVCGAFDQGESPDSIQSMINETLKDDTQAILAAKLNASYAVQILCPMYSNFASEFNVDDIASNSNNQNNSSACDPNYSGACVPIVPYDLDCPDIGQLVLVVGNDIHKFDRDRDGRACES
jgi:hypothetical protein